MFDLLRLLFSAHEGLWPWLDLLFLSTAVFAWRSGLAAFALRGFRLASALTRARALLINSLFGATLCLGLGAMGWVRGQAIFHSVGRRCVEAETLWPCTASASLALGTLGLSVGAAFLLTAAIGGFRWLDARGSAA
jgi:hypothetical protein